MLTSLLIGAIAPHSPKIRILSDDHGRAAQYAIDHLDDVRAIEVDVCHHAVGGVDTAGSDDDHVDFALILRASRDDASQGTPLYLEAHDEDTEMSLTGAFIKGGGGFAPTVGGGMIDMFRQQDPGDVNFRVDPYVL